MSKKKAISNEEIIAALLSSGTISEAAAKLNITPRSIYDRMCTRDFKAAYQAAKSDLIRGAVLKINQRLTDAIETVIELMTDKDVNPSTRLQAAQTILTNAAKFAERLQCDEAQVVANTEEFICF